ncbi:MAG TPA: formyltransferase family protein [Salinimicrobium sp.]|nr:formyltransferase family protein [Salinimicrobium sp.]
MRVVLFTSNRLRHKYIAHKLVESLQMELIVAEDKSAKIEETSDLSKADAQFIEKHFAARTASETVFFGQYERFPPGTPLLQVPHSEINSDKVLLELEQINPEIIVLFGSSIIKKEILGRFPRKLINLHLGLSPYYKGSATNLFPFYFKEPECVGATIHVATSKVDGGGILHQLRPNMEIGDTLHDIGNKTIKQAGEQLPGILKNYSENKIEPLKQVDAGKLCKIKDLGPELLREIYRNFEAGMIGDYLKNKGKRDWKKPIIEEEARKR